MNQKNTSGLILVVDDNSTNLSMLSEVLDEAGLHYRVAMDGKSALALVERNRPDLILLDVQMPGIDGFETCRRLKENPDFQSIPVIFTTALTDTDSKAKAFSLGAIDYIPKPFDQAEVLSRVKVHLELNRLRQSLEDQVRDRTAALQKAQVQLVQQEKLSGLGEMVAGIAHEINNPINFIASNIDPLKDCVESLTEALSLYQKACPDPTTELQNALADLDLDFALEDIGKILNSFVTGTDRIKSISNSLRTFSRADSESPALADLHQGLDSTLVILQHRLKGKGDRPTIEVLKSYGQLPSVRCYPGQMNQVFMNILANAIDAIEDAISQGKLQDLTPQIHITTQKEGKESIAVSIGDNGVGVPEAIQERLFESLFTTKPVGKGTGLGLAIAHQIVIEKHQGQLNVESQIGKGTTFKIVIPLF
ncbi:MAG: sensor histidine kinase [Leptolyngbyaceae cyanobacterium]